ncbi:E3 ubiquitin-protein ligase TRIP12 [Trypanosoma rangeli]|uniref:HECT-type E3 ubiquitin transferase n=1 Tax=Trypanosoma rangeli TaxID=5698 RepID=A0A422P1G3_TRYRA|nr:E3 ubiquitin-protein ligase TRIP12 [Trypanosoma rangeli]RNF11539.1 E3 ubiquitin-protein ligase TRIP12 [Trypanosoma rangeli]|eukprot:RNF11539.1 E3 ubiquitin-protein ligase TRIP12 [Trypanosoma rangeli]
MEGFFNRILMDAEGGVAQRKVMKEVVVTRENITSVDEERQMVGLMNLCNLLNMATSVTISSIRPSVFVPHVLECLKKEHNVDLMLLAARVLTYMVDAIPSTVYVLGSENGMEAVLQHLLEVKDIELSEQCMTCLEKITQSANGALTGLQKGGVKALLAFVDFFSSSSQRKAWASVAAMCRRVDATTFDRVHDSLNEIRARVNHEDGKIGDKAIACLYRIITGVRTNPELVARAYGDVSPALLCVLARSDVTESTFTMTLSLIGAAITYSAEVTRKVTESGLMECMLALITHYSEQQIPQLQQQQRSSFPQDVSTQMSSTPAPTSLTTTFRERRLTMEQTKILCIALAGLLPRITEGYLAYGNILTELLAERNQGIMNSRGYFSTDTDYDDEEDEEDGEGNNIEETRMRILEEEIPLERNPNFSRCNISHVCNGCGKLCMPGDWFRCNKCSDFDYCGQCLLESWAEHTGNSAQHTFCDMLEVISGLSKLTMPATVKKSLDDALNMERRDLYRNSPQLLESILRGLPKMVMLFNESETQIVRNHSLAFIDRAVCLASPQQLMNSGLNEAAVCQLIVSAIGDPSLILNAQVMLLCRTLLEKLPAVYKKAFVREGVTSALLKARGQNQTTTRRASERQEEKRPLVERLCTIADWRELVAEEANSMLGMFSSISDETHIKRLAEFVSLMEEGQLQEAFDTLRVALLNETTSFELASSNVLHALRETLTRVNDVRVIVDLVKTLAKGERNSPCALTRFVRHLQTIFSQLDQFRPSSFGGVNSIHAHIPVHLVSHAAEQQKPKPSLLAKSGALRRSPPATSSKESSGPPRSTRVFTTRGNNTTSHASTLTGFTSTSTRGVSEGRELTVSLEPLTSMDTLMSFVASNVLPGGAEENGGRRRIDDEEHVEDVLPELRKGEPTDLSLTGKKLMQEKPEQRVYLRYESHVLPPSMTILQVLQQFHSFSSSSGGSSYRKRKKKSGQGSGTASNNNNVTGTTAANATIATTTTSTSGGGGRVRQRNSMGEGLRRSGGEIITLHYSTVPFGPEYTMEKPRSAATCVAPTDATSVKLPSKGVRSPAVAEVLRALHQEYPFSNCFLTAAQKDVLTLLGTIYKTLQCWGELLLHLGYTTQGDVEGDVWSPSTPLGEFIHQRLNNKAMRHSSNLLLAGQHLATWAVNLAMDCNFLFTAATRKFLFEIGFCGTARSLVQMQENMEKYGTRDLLNVDHHLIRSYRLHRMKKRVWRDKALLCAMEILGKKQINDTVLLEFEYYNENGSGSGPTMEFYSLVSDELREMKLRLWRRTDETPDEKYYHPKTGVYPRPLPPDSPEIDRVEPLFLFLGRFLARALLDKRIVSLPLSPALLKILRGDECGIYDLIDISESLGSSIVTLSLAAHNGATSIQLPGASTSCSVEDLLLDFTLPGDDAIELVKGGANKPVTSANLFEYCDAVTEFILHKGVERVMKAFRTGFHDYIPLCALRLLTVAELHEALHGHAALVTIEDLEANCQADHGYTMTCSHVRQLFEIIASFNEEEQRRFFLFLTGSVHLPVGGLASLRPKFTIVRKTSSEPKVREQDQLPSAMTCQNYLKLPAYDSKEQMEKKLRQAIDEGGGAFLLT